jgi:serine/threonine protein kinase
MSDEHKLIGGRYLLTNCLRKTGFCETYVAKDTHLPGNPLCVVKKLQPQSNEDFVLDTARRLFVSEANVLYKLSNHEQIPRLSAHLEVDEQFYLVQEFIEGKDLSQDEIVPGNSWDEKDVRHLLKEVLEILSFVHKNNVIHRDIKPSNLIRRDSDGKIVLIDFGAVKEISNMTLTEGQGNLLTVAIGTPGYMSSEQQRGDPRFSSDIYALGMTAVQAITGFHPDQLPRDRDTGELSWRDRAPNCSAGLAKILDKMIRNDFRERYQNVNEALDDLQRLEGKPKSIPSNQSNSDTILRTGGKQWLWLFILPLTLGIAFLTPRIWNTFQALQAYNEGNELNKAGEYEKAIEAFERAISTKPDFAVAWTNKGYAQGQLGRHEDKLDSCGQAAINDPEFAEAWNCKGLAWFDLGNYERALQEYNKAIAVDPEFYNGWFNKGQVLLRLGQPRESITATHTALSLQPNSVFAWSQICQALYQLKQYQDAKAHCEEALKLNPKHETSQIILKQIESKLKQP